MFEDRGRLLRAAMTYGLAIAGGIALALWQLPPERRGLWTKETVSTSGATSTHHSASDPTSGRRFRAPTGTPATPVVERPPFQLGDVYAGNGRVALQPAYREGRFVGYRVSGRSGDYRYQHGDIITHVGEEPVEDSAAGSELVLIALQQPERSITTRP